MITKHPTSRTLLVHPLGDMDTLRADHYRRQLRSLIDEGYRFLIFDLQDTPYINSSGLGLLIELYNKATRLEGSVKLINCSPHVTWILEQTQLNKILIDSSAAGGEKSEAEIHYDSLYTLMSDELLLLTQIYETTEQMLGVDDPLQIGELTLKGIHKALHAQRGALLLRTSDGKALKLVAWVDRDDNPPPEQFQDIPLRPGRMETSLLEGAEVAWHELCDQDKSEDNVFYKLNFETIIAAPIGGRNEKFGLMVLEAGPETLKLMQTSRPLVRTFSNICGLAMEKASLNQQLQNRNGQLDAMIGRAHDYRQTLIDAGKLAALGVVMTGLGHLINNKMVPLLGYAQMLSQKKDLSSWVTEKLARIQASGNEMHEIVEKLTKISRVHERVNKPVDHVEQIRIALDLLTMLIERDGIAVHVQTATDAPPIVGNPDLLLQAILAVLHRSCTSFKSDATTRCINILSQGCEDGLKIVIEDNGAEFDEYDQDGWLDPVVPFEAMEGGRIFNYTIPRSIIKKHRGKLTLEPVRGGGKRVIIDLPAVKEAVAAAD